VVVTFSTEKEGHVRIAHTGNMVPDLMYSAVKIQSPRGAFSVPL